MALNDLGVETPADTDDFAPASDMRELGDSFAGRIIIPVANTTERDALATDLSPSTSEPLFVWRADAADGSRLEWTEDGSTWKAATTDIGDDTPSAVTGTSPFTSSATVQRVGHFIVFGGSFARASSFSTSFVAAGQVPVGYEPAANITFPAVIAWTGAVTYQVAVSTAGVVTIRMTAATSGPLYVEGLVWAPA